MKRIIISLGLLATVSFPLASAGSLEVTLDAGQGGSEVRFQASESEVQFSVRGVKGLLRAENAWAFSADAALNVEFEARSRLMRGFTARITEEVLLSARKLPSFSHLS